MLDILLDSLSLFSPSTITDSASVIAILPPFPSFIPKVSVEIKPPFITSNEPVVISIFPAFPSALEFILLVIELDSRLLFSPSTTTNPVALIVISPASAAAISSTLLEIKPPFVTSNESVVISIFPAFNTAGDDISLDILLDSLSLFSPSTTTDSASVIVIFPPSPIPSLLLEIKPPFVTSNESVVISIFPAFSSPVCENCENKMLDTLLESPSLFSPSTITDSASVIVIFPPSPIPNVSVEIKPPFVSSNEFVLIAISPAFPSAFSSIVLEN